MLRLLIALVAIGAFFWWWEDPGTPGACRTVAYPVRCQGDVIGNECHGELGAALARREFLVDRGPQRVTERGAAPGHCSVSDCANWKCMDEIFLRTARDGQFREELRPGLTAVDPRRTLSAVYVPAWKWWQLRAEHAARRALSGAWRK